MADQEGWIKVHRRMLDSAVWLADDPVLFMVWIWCLLRASHRERQAVIGNEVYELEPGEFFTGRFKGAKQCHVPPSTFRDKMRLLEKMGNVRQRADSLGTRVTILNWATYQLSDYESRQPTDSSPTDGRQPADTNNNDKKVKKEESDLFGHAPAKRRRGNPSAHDLQLLFPGVENLFARGVVESYKNHCGELREPISFESIKTLVSQQGEDRVLYAMRIVVVKGWRKIGKAFEYMQENIEDAKLKSNFATFKEKIHEPR
jgi:hypothetical protein